MLWASTVRRWLAQDAIKPSQHRSWIFIRDREFRLKASRVLDLYARIWQGNPLGGDEYVISCDEKTLGHASGSISHGGGYQVNTSLSTSSALPSTRRSTSPFPGTISGDVR